MMPIDPLFSPDMPVPPRSDLTTYSNDAWQIDLPKRWRVVPSGRDNTVTFQSDADDAARVLLECVIAAFIGHVVEDEQGAGDADGQAQDIERRVTFSFAEGSPGKTQVIF